MTTMCACGFNGCTGPVDYLLDQGADWTNTITLTDSTGAPINLTGASAVMQARAYPGKPTNVFSLSSGGTSPAITLGGAAGTVAWKIPAAQTAAFVPALNTPVGFLRTPTVAFLGYYDLVVTSSTGGIINYQHGKLLMLLGISNVARANGQIPLPNV